MKQVFINNDGISIQEVPPPLNEGGRVLIRLYYSSISTGTEMSGLGASDTPLWRRALKEPQKVKKVMEKLRAQGVSETYGMVSAKLNELHPLGYSAAGEVVEIGPEITDLRVGDRVACGGAANSYHADLVSVPRNLVVRIPETVDLDVASTVTLGAIAMQGVRRADTSLGEIFIVLGLGLLGQLTQQMLRVNGVRVIGVDLESERVKLARDTGIWETFLSDGEDLSEKVMRLTDGYGADGVIITASGSSNQILSTAFKCCRRKGRVVLVGDVGLNINRSDIYEKELDFLVSTSYGPGRYDRNYEEEGLDYPLPYVRWTENRNMSEYLRLIRDGQLEIKPLIEKIYPIDSAGEAYQSLKGKVERPLLLLISYSGTDKSINRVITSIHRKASIGKVRIAIIGAGGFAQGTLLPIMTRMKSHFELAGIVTHKGHNAVNIARRFGAGFASTDYHEVLADDNVDSILIATRHNLHGSLVLEALRAGKHVFVEKPLCLKQHELDAIKAFFKENGNYKPLLMVGFNRRFSPYVTAIRDALADRCSPMILDYRVNAGPVSSDNWIHSEEGGGRNLGEACHFYNLFLYLTGSDLVESSAVSISSNNSWAKSNENFVATLSFQDGSLATLTYTSLGSQDFPKESLDIFCDNKVLSIEDFQKFSVVGDPAVRNFTTRNKEKGHREELEEFAKAIQAGGDCWPIPLNEQIDTTQVALNIERYL